MTREELQELMSAARTLEDIQRVKKLVNVWLKKHPGDRVIMSEMESVVMMEEALEIIEQEKSEKR